MPTPLRAAATVPATCVPWSLVVGRQPPAVWSATPLVVQLTESLASKFGARSGWASSTPLSLIPTRTLREPSVIAWAWSALIWTLSHCSFSRGSGTGAVAVSRSDEVTPAAVADAAGVPSVTAAVRVAPTDWTSRPSLPDLIAVLKSGLVDCATTTPICRYETSTVPPAALTAFSTLRM